MGSDKGSKDKGRVIQVLLFIKNKKVLLTFRIVLRDEIIYSKHLLSSAVS